MSKLLEFTIDADCAGTRLDRCLSRLIPGSSRSYLQKLIKDGMVKHGSEAITLPRFPVKSGMVLQIEMPETPEVTLSAGEFDYDILYEDSDMLVIHKPAGVVVHPAAGNPDGTVVNALLGRYPDIQERFACENNRPGIVHRLDKDTSGCLAIAKTPDAQFKLGNAFAGRETGKTYLAICRGIPERKSGELTTLIGRHPVNRQKMAIVERNGKNAVSEYEVIDEGRINNVKTALVKVRIYTGRTHQIRVHLASLGCPVLGDELYGGAKACPGIPRQMLHAWKLKVPHPKNGEMVKVQAPIPEDMEKIYRLMKSE